MCIFCFNDNAHPKQYDIKQYCLDIKNDDRLKKSALNNICDLHKKEMQQILEKFNLTE